MRRREFITLLSGAAVGWPLAARAQQDERVRRIGVLIPAGADDAGFQTFVGAFLQALAQSGWTIGRKVRIDTRWATGDPAEIRRHAAELVVLAPDVILSHGTSTVAPLLQATRTVPIVFTALSDPVAAGFVDNSQLAASAGPRRPPPLCCGFAAWPRAWSASAFRSTAAASRPTENYTHGYANPRLCARLQPRRVKSQGSARAAWSSFPDPGDL